MKENHGLRPCLVRLLAVAFAPKAKSSTKGLKVLWLKSNFLHNANPKAPLPLLSLAFREKITHLPLVM
jgi:hypothetical protein